MNATPAAPMALMHHQQKTPAAMCKPNDDLVGPSYIPMRHAGANVPYLYLHAQAPQQVIYVALTSLAHAQLVKVPRRASMWIPRRECASCNVQ
jgi:hypothetical protein